MSRGNGESQRKRLAVCQVLNLRWLKGKTVSIGFRLSGYERGDKVEMFLFCEEMGKGMGTKMWSRKRCFGFVDFLSRCDVFLLNDGVFSSMERGGRGRLKRRQQVTSCCATERVSERTRR